MTKSQLLADDLERALKRLKEALVLPENSINQDATIQRFEFTFELSWKLMQSLLRENGIEGYGVKNIIREAVRLGLVDDPAVWFEFLEARNLTVHTYKEDVAKKVYRKAAEFAPFVDSLLKKAKTS